jgi:hypothetical protein
MFAPVPATPQQIAQKVTMPYACATYLYAPLSTIYSFKMDALKRPRGTTCRAMAARPRPATTVCSAACVNSKEIIDWTWQTFWWQPRQDTPNNFPGSKAGMTTNVKGPWRNYASCSAYNQTEGKTSTKMVVCFNPFLETSSGIPAGLTSNCMSCHGVATVAATGNNINSLPYPRTMPRPISVGEGIDQSIPDRRVHPDGLLFRRFR